jgi:hypothetical protein
MSRFLSSFKRLSRKVAKLELYNLSGELGPALAHYGATGELPPEPWLRQKVLWHKAVANAMFLTVPACTETVAEPPPIPQQDIGEMVKPGQLVHGHGKRGV